MENMVMKKMRRELTLTVGVFFDGSGNNAYNTECMLNHYANNDAIFSTIETATSLQARAKRTFGFTGAEAVSYTGYFTNIHWLKKLYLNNFLSEEVDIQTSLYIDGVGTEAGKPDTLLALSFGISENGIVAKVNNAMVQSGEVLSAVIHHQRQRYPGFELVLKALRFDLFGFSRGAAAARHFANIIYSADPEMTRVIKEALQGTVFHGPSCGIVRFIGIFDTVGAVGTASNGWDPHSADTGDVNLELGAEVAESVFHLIAAQECRYNFALNSVSPVWPELMLPGTHSDIGGGYMPVMREDLFLTRPVTETVLARTPGPQTRGYSLMAKQGRLLESYPSLEPILQTGNSGIETWDDERMSPNRYGEPQKRCYTAVTLRDRLVRNDLAKIALRVMLTVATEAGVAFKPLNEALPEFALPSELLPFCERAIEMGKNTVFGQLSTMPSQQQLDIISRYIHCSAHWNTVCTDVNGAIQGGAFPSVFIGFINRPDRNWRRTVYGDNALIFSLT
jgi:hypothetical protein